MAKAISLNNIASRDDSSDGGSSSSGGGSWLSFATEWRARQSLHFLLAEAQAVQQASVLPGQSSGGGALQLTFTLLQGGDAGTPLPVSVKLAVGGDGAGGSAGGGKDGGNDGDSGKQSGQATMRLPAAAREHVVAAARKLMDLDAAEQRQQAVWQLALWVCVNVGHAEARRLRRGVPR